jgi:hypothetical protein
MSRLRNPIWPFTEADLAAQRSVKVVPDSATPERLLQVSTEYFVAGSVWKKIGGSWSCILAAPIIKWMVGMRPDQAKLSLLKMGADYQFLPATQVMVASDGVSA